MPKQIFIPVYSHFKLPFNIADVPHIEMATESNDRVDGTYAGLAIAQSSLRKLKNKELRPAPIASAKSCEAVKVCLAKGSLPPKVVLLLDVKV